MNANGRIASSSGGARIRAWRHYLIDWSDTFPVGCVPVVTVLGTASLLSPAAGYANARVTGSHPTRVWVSTYSPQGVPEPEPFSLAVVC